MASSRSRVPPEEDYPTQFLKGIYSPPQCDWCKDPYRQIYRLGLCSSCYRIRRTVAKRQAELDECKKKRRNIPFEVKFNLVVARRMARSAKADGNMYGNIHRKNIAGLDIERELVSLSNRLLGKEMFWGGANLFNWSFSLSQKRLFFHILSRLQREFLRRHRRAMAESRSIA